MGSVVREAAVLGEETVNTCSLSIRPPLSSSYGSVRSFSGNTLKTVLHEPSTSSQLAISRLEIFSNWLNEGRFTAVNTKLGASTAKVA